MNCRKFVKMSMVFCSLIGRWLRLLLLNTRFSHASISFSFLLFFRESVREKRERNRKKEIDRSQRRKIERETHEKISDYGATTEQPSERPSNRQVALWSDLFRGGIINGENFLFDVTFFRFLVTINITSCSMMNVSCSKFFCVADQDE